MNCLDEYDEEDTQFFDAHDDATHDVEGYEESGDPMYHNDDWSMTCDGTDHSLSMIRLGSVGISDKPTPIHYLEKTMNEGVSRYCVCCLSIANRQSGNYIHDLSRCHFEMLKILVQWILHKIQNHLLQYHRGEQLNICTFGVFPPIQHFSDDTCPLMMQHEL